ncbi:uncharacterized protein LOC143776563 [Ranitomeya variabilis]|uniref:uncharacterized protein LOC143776563 n=1 Tax=Ranitomeya variabilis TaxID=490064 RepID=UPI004056F9CC
MKILHHTQGLINLDLIHRMDNHKVAHLSILVIHLFLQDISPASQNISQDISPASQDISQDISPASQDISQDISPASQDISQDIQDISQGSQIIKDILSMAGKVVNLQHQGTWNLQKIQYTL